MEENAKRYKIKENMHWLIPNSHEATAERRSFFLPTAAEVAVSTKACVHSNDRSSTALNDIWVPSGNDTTPG